MITDLFVFNVQKINRMKNNKESLINVELFITTLFFTALKNIFTGK
jgi:hypothetical protein